jgi:SAM-dependent methyltransferase
VTCIACGSADSRVLYEVRGYPIARCAGCGLARTVLPDGFDPGAIYTEDYFQGGHHDGYADYAGSAELLRREFRRTLDALPARGGALVELGCAYGFFLDEARERFDACGVEVSDAARAACEARGHTVARDLQGVLPLGPFDTAVMLDVIEHLERPDEIIAALADTLKPNASLLITTGDFGSPLARAMGRRWRLMTPPQHLWFFSPHTLGALLSRHGFRIQSVTHPWKWVPLQLIAYQATRGKRVRIPGSVPVNLFDAMRVVAIRA